MIRHVVLHGYAPDQSEKLQDQLALVLAVAGGGNVPAIQEAPMVGGGSPYIEVSVTSGEDVHPILENMFVSRIYERMEISGCTQLFLEAGDFIGTGWVQKLRRTRSDRRLFDR